MRLKYAWRVTHIDDSVIDEWDEFGKQRPLTVIFEKPIKHVQLIKRDTNKVTVTVHISEGQKPIIRRRWGQPVNMQTLLPAGPRRAVWLIGKHWCIEVGGEL